MDPRLQEGFLSQLDILKASQQQLLSNAEAFIQGVQKLEDENVTLQTELTKLRNGVAEPDSQNARESPEIQLANVNALSQDQDLTENSMLDARISQLSSVPNMQCTPKSFLVDLDCLETVGLKENQDTPLLPVKKWAADSGSPHVKNGIDESSATPLEQPTCMCFPAESLPSAGDDVCDLTNLTHELENSRRLGGEFTAKKSVEFDCASIDFSEARGSLYGRPSAFSEACTESMYASSHNQSIRGESDVFDVLDVWLQQRILKRGLSKSVHDLKKHDVDHESKRKRSLILSPTGRQRGFWDFMCFLFITYDTVMIPLQMFDLEENRHQRSFIWVQRIFWSTDIPVTFLTGIIRHDGSIDFKCLHIAKRYAKTWLAIDIFIVLNDWSEVIFELVDWSGYMRAGKVTRAFRIMRMMRLVRVIRIASFVKRGTEHIVSEVMVIVSEMLKFLLVILTMAHCIACIWYGIGARDTPENTWLTGDRTQGLPSASILLKYSISLHWALSQFNGGMDEVTPENEAERVYAVSVFIVCFTAGAIFISSLTSAMTQLNLITSRQSQQMSQLRKYLNINSISSHLSTRIQRNAHHVLSDKLHYLPESSVELLSKISDPLRVELHFEVYHSVFLPHPFFACYSKECPHVIKGVCHRAMAKILVSKGDIIFHAAMSPEEPKMYFVCTGALTYVHQKSGEETILRDQDWLSEATLWTTWIHRGDLIANSDCRLVALDAKAFQDIASKFHTQNVDVTGYAKEFVRNLNTGKSRVSDLPSLATASHESLVTNFVLHQTSMRWSVAQASHGIGSAGLTLRSNLSKKFSGDRLTTQSDRKMASFFC